jgi:hypothetical protein
MRVKNQFAGFGVPVNGVTEFLYVRETALCLNIEYTETAPCLWSVHNSAREIAIETLPQKDGFKTSSLDLLEMFLVNG